MNTFPNHNLDLTNSCVRGRATVVGVRGRPDYNRVQAEARKESWEGRVKREERAERKWEKGRAYIFPLMASLIR